MQQKLRFFYTADTMKKMVLNGHNMKIIMVKTQIQMQNVRQKNLAKPMII